VAARASPAPPIPAGLPWLNVARPPSPEELTGRLCLLHFWTGSRVDCQHAWAALDRLMARLAGEPVLLVGVHSPRFPHERDPAAARAAVARLGVVHPVVLDADHALWRQHGVRAWPWLVLVDPAGRVAGHAPGEPEVAALEAEVVHLLARARADGQELAISPLPLRPEPAPPGALAWPSKLLASGGTLWVADAGRGEVAEYQLPARGAARLRRRLGGFGRPHGLALDEARGHLYVADPARQLIWRADLASGHAAPVAGTAALGRSSLAPGAFAPGREVALRSPWDLAWDAARDRLLVAMAGAHQLWSLEPARDRLRALAGQGREGRLDGDLEDAAFAQPSGLALDGPRLWVADAESSSVRQVELATGLVRTVAGGDLLEFGHADGRGDAARFQHPTGLALLPGGEAAVVADAFNGALRRVARGGAVTTLAPPGLDLLEPDGLALVDGGGAGRLLVADSGHRRVVALDLGSGAWEVVAGAESG
jgi:sugar lactone lactonase YvrE